MRLQLLPVAALPPASCTADADADSIGGACLSESLGPGAGSCPAGGCRRARGTGIAAPASTRCTKALVSSAEGALGPSAGCIGSAPGSGGAEPCGEGAEAPSGSRAAPPTGPAPGIPGTGLRAAGAVLAPATRAGRLRRGLRGGNGCKGLPAHADVVVEFGLFGTEGSCKPQVGVSTAFHSMS